MSVNKLSIDFEWDDPGAVKSPELRATWASLTMSVDDEPITRVYSHRDKGVRESIYVSLYPLAEWVSENWFFLIGETGSDVRFEHGFDRRHNMRFSGDGFMWPNLRIKPIGDLTQLEWWRRKMPGGLEYLSQGDVHVPSKDAEEHLRNLMESTVRRLQDAGVTDTRLQENWRSIERLDVDEIDYCKFVAKSGVDPFAIAPELGNRLIRLNEQIDPGMIDDVLDLVTVSQLDKAVSSVGAAVNEVRDFGCQLRGIDLLRDAVASEDDLIEAPPWEVGYGMARKARKLLHAGVDPLDLGKVFGNVLDDSTTSVMPESLPLSAMVEAGETDAKAILFRRGRVSKEALRFEACRAAFAAATVSPGRFAVVAPTFSARQKAARAFAADFLAPADGLRERIASPLLWDDDVEELAGVYGVTDSVIRHQVVNHSLAELA